MKSEPRKVVLAVAFVGVGALAAAACANVLGFEELHVGDAGAFSESGTFDSTVDASSDASPDSSPQCTHTRWPDRPDDAGGGTTSFISAVRFIDFGLGEDAGANLTPPGFDLDRFCTVTAGDNSCGATLGSSDFQTYVADKGGLNGGTDNAGYGLLKYLGMVGDTIKQDKLNDSLAAGAYGILVRVSGWNGMPEDPDVFVEWFPMIGVRGADGGLTAPRFDLNDAWIRDSAYWNTLTYDTSSIIDQAAYVTGGKVVARLDSLAVSLPFYTSYLTIILHDGVVVADIVEASPSIYRLSNGTFAGRWSSRELLAGVKNVYHPLLGSYLCKSAMVYGQVKNTACPARDIMGLERNDGTDAGCNAVSIGARFDTAVADDQKRFAARVDGGDPCVGAPVPPNDDCP